LLSYLEAILRVYNRYGRRDNIFKARIKILVREIGAPEFIRQVEEEWPQIRKTGVNLPPRTEKRASAASSSRPPYETIAEPVAALTEAKNANLASRVDRDQRAYSQGARLCHRHHFPEAARRYSG